MRLILLALFGLGAAALAVTLLAWLAERQLHRTAAALSFADVSKVPAADVALVLGTAPIGPEGGPNRYFVYRLDAAAELWKAGKVKYLLVSGNRDGDYEETAKLGHEQQTPEGSRPASYDPSCETAGP